MVPGDWKNDRVCDRPVAVKIAVSGENISTAVPDNSENTAKHVVGSLTEF
jgi:hypothetical protein